VAQSYLQINGRWRNHVLYANLRGPTAAAGPMSARPDRASVNAHAAEPG
jgi:hypothetical protein